CSYPSKLCNNHRANVNQQRMQQKLIRQQMVER
uniref:Secreted protein F2 (Fragments) n=1 Tax=Globisporangium hypogynum TaxID=255163 RepID=SPF2_GLOHY|nr:RecName: Full=Secreted protein F2 [Globisporangium hypogynum]